MVEYESKTTVVFHALAHESRRAMLARLASAELTIGELAAPLSMSLAAASKHVSVLEKAGLLHRRVVGRRHHCRLEPAPLEAASEWFKFYERFWTDRLNALEDLMLTTRSNKRKKTK